MAQDNWEVEAAAAWSALQNQARLGRVQAYRDGDVTPVDLPTTVLAEVTDDFTIFVEPKAG